MVRLFTLRGIRTIFVCFFIIHTRLSITHIRKVGTKAAENEITLEELRDKFYDKYDMKIGRYYFKREHVFMDDINQSFISRIFHMQPYEWIYSCANMVRISIDEEYDNHTESNRGGRALVGGLMFGTVGAVVGAVSGTQKQVNNLTKLKMKFYERSNGDHLFTINLLREFHEVSVNVNSMKYREIIDFAQNIIHWHDRYSY